MKTEKSLSFEDVVKKVVEDALSTRVVMPLPIYANRIDTASKLGISVQTLDRLFIQGRLKDGIHTTTFIENGSKMYYLPEIVKTLSPKHATIMIFGNQEK